MKGLFERLKICYFALTKRYYAFFAIQRIVYKHSGSQCFISDNAEKNLVFMLALNAYSGKLLEKARKYNTVSSKPAQGCDTSIMK